MESSPSASRPLAELSSGNIVVRTFNSETSTFPFKGSETPSAPTVVEESFNIFRVGFKRRLQDIVFYKKEGNIYEPDVSFTTDIALSAIPESVKIGFTYSGTKPTDLKNIAVNGARFRDIHTVPIPVESSPAPAPEPSPVPAPEPTYNLSRNISNVNEGDSFTITLTTQGVDNGVTVPYTISGVEPADIDDAPLTGNFTINNNTATKTFNVTEDFTTEGNETFTLTLNGQSESISVILNDTSTPEDQSLSVLFIGNSRPFNVRSQDTDEIFSNTQYEEPGGHDTLNDKIDSDDYDIIVLNNVDWTNNGVFDPNQTTYEKLKGFVERGGVVFDSVEHSSYNNYNFNGNTGTTSGVVSNIAYDLGGIIGLNSGWKARSSILREDLYLSTEAQDNNIITILDTDVVDFAQVINNSRSRGYPLLNIDSADGATSVLHMWDGGVPGQLNSGIDGKIIMLGESIDIYLSDYFITSLLGYIARTKV